MPRFDPNVAPARPAKPPVRPIVKAHFETKSVEQARELIAALDRLDVKPVDVQITESWNGEWEFYADDWEPYDPDADEEGNDEDDIDV